MTARPWYVPWQFHALGESWLLQWERVNAPAQTIPAIEFDEDGNGGRRWLSRAQMDALIARHVPGHPDLFIFHVGRCGSTLLARLLGSHPSVRVRIEPDYLGRFLAQTSGWPRDRFLKVVKPMLHTCGVGARPGQRIVIKFASHALYRLPEIRESFPDVPAVLVYRDPLEVLSALSAVTSGFLHRRAAWLVEMVGGPTPAASSMTQEQLAAEYLRGLFTRASAHAETFERLINYIELPDVAHELHTRILQVGDAVSTQQAQNVVRWHSKDRSRAYVADGEMKRRGASDFLRTACDRWLRPCYDGLESRRLTALTMARHQPQERHTE